MNDFSTFMKNLNHPPRHGNVGYPQNVRDSVNVRHPQDSSYYYRQKADPRTVRDGSHHSKTAYRPQSVVSRARNNSSVLTQIRQKKQKPLHARSSVKQPHPRVDRPQQNPARHEPRHKTKPLAPSSSFSMPLLPALALLVVGTMLLAFNWNNISQLLTRDVVSEGSRGRIERAYAEGIPNNTDISGALPQTDLPEAESQDELSPSEPGIITEASAVNVQEPLNEEIPLKMVEYFAWISHTVKSGESVSKIAANYGLSLDAVIASNELSNANVLRVGQTLRIPNMNGIPYTVKRGDNLSKISKAWNIPLSVIVNANNIQSDVIHPGQTIFLPGARMSANDLKLALGQLLFESPLKGSNARLSSTFGWRTDPFEGGESYHAALDLAAPTGTPVKAAAAGKVSMVSNSPVYGRYIIISHDDNIQTLYAHLSATSVTTGAAVNQGAKIGEVGSTGRSTGPHLHFALYKDGNAVNPLDYLKL